MQLPFETHDIYITYLHRTIEKDWTTLYKLNNDLTTSKVKDNTLPKPTKPFLLINQSEFEVAKDFLFDPLNPFKISRKNALFYLEIDFITNGELKTFLNS